MLQDDIDPRYKFQNGLLYYQRLLYVFKDSYQFQVLQSQHNFSTMGHLIDI